MMAPRRKAQYTLLRQHTIFIHEHFAIMEKDVEYDDLIWFTRCMPEFSARK
jgi:hypothetical protein